MKKLVAFIIIGSALVIAVLTSNLPIIVRLAGLAVVAGFVYAFIKHGPGKKVGEEIKEELDDLKDKFDKK